MSRTLLIAFHAAEAAGLVGFANLLGFPFDLLLFCGDDAPEVGAEVAFLARSGQVPPADAVATSIRSRAQDYTHFAAASSMLSKDVMPRLAALLGGAMLTDVVAVESPTVFKRPILAGSVIATVEALQSPIVCTVRTTAFLPAVGINGRIETIELSGDSAVRVTARIASGTSRPDLSQAKVVVSGGRPLRDAATFEKLIGGLADSLGGAVGATRAAVDSGIAGNELQVGQTGKIVAPELYIAAGISGSTQHMAGIKDSKLIVAINKDPDAPIFQFADLGLVADLFEAIPSLQAKLGK